MPDIYKLWEQIENHPDFAGGALFTRDSVAQACFDIEPGEETPEDIARVTESMMEHSRMTIESYVFSSTYTWMEALKDNVPVA